MLKLFVYLQYVFLISYAAILPIFKTNVMLIVVVDESTERSRSTEIKNTI